MPLHGMNNKWMSKGITPNDRLHTVRADGAIRAFRALVFSKVEEDMLFVKEYDGDTNLTRKVLGMAYTEAADADELTLIALGPICKGVLGTGENVSAGDDCWVKGEAGGTIAGGTWAPDGTTQVAYLGTFLQDGTAGDVVQFLLTGNGLESQ